MGILNITPDSFADGGLYQDRPGALEKIEEMVKQGADIVDIGGESTRPGSDPVSEEDELGRVMPVIEKAVQYFPELIFSIDTTKYKVARSALEYGVHIVNDVSGLRKEPRFADLCAEFKAGYVLMHSQGNPKTMQQNPAYDDVVSEISEFFEKRINKLRKSGVESIILDPGIGFGKTLDHNVKIVNGLEKFTTFNCPVLIGASRKSMIGQLLNNRPVAERLTGTICVHYQSLLNGSKILRVHDVQEAADSIQIFNSLNS